MTVEQGADLASGQVETRRILFLEQFGAHGGSQSVLLDLIADLDRHRYEPHALLLSSGPLEHELRALGVPVAIASVDRLRQVHRVIWAMARASWMSRRRRIDVIHANGSALLLFAGVTARLARCGVVWHVYDPQTRRGRSQAALIAVQRRMHPDFTIFGTPAVADTFLSAYPDIGRHQVILPGVDADKLLAGGDPAAARRRFDVPQSAPLATMWARVVSYKGHLDLLRAVESLSDAHPDLHVLMCGGLSDDDPYVQQVTQAIRGSGLEQRVRLTGHVDPRTKAGLLLASDLVVHPAHHEPLGLPPIEAMAAGKPVIAADAIGPRTTVAHGLTGLLYPAGDATALAKAMSHLLANPDVAERMGAAGRRRASERYSRDATAAAVRSAWDRVAACR